MSSSPQPPSILCEQTQEAILALLDDEFDQEQQAVLAQHLPTCPACQAYHESMQHLTLSLRKLEDVPLPSGLESRIMARIAEENTVGNGQSAERMARSLPARHKKWPKMAPIAAAIMALAMALPVLYQALNLGDEPNASSVNSARSWFHGQPTASATKAGHGENTVGAFNFPPMESAPSSMGHATGGTQPVVQQAPMSARTQAASAMKTDANPDKNANPVEVASTLPASMNVDSAYASSKEGDIYFDPLSNVVDF